MRISGPAGTGKSTVLRCIIRLARELFVPDAQTGHHDTALLVHGRVSLHSIAEGPHWQVFSTLEQVSTLL
jgi:cytidylate kinase